MDSLETQNLAFLSFLYFSLTSFDWGVESAFCAQDMILERIIHRPSPASLRLIRGFFTGIVEPAFGTSKNQYLTNQETELTDHTTNEDDLREFESVPSHFSLAHEPFFRARDSIIMDMVRREPGNTDAPHSRRLITIVSVLASTM